MSQTALHISLFTLCDDYYMSNNFLIRFIPNFRHIMFGGDDFPFRAMGMMQRQMMEDMDSMMDGMLGNMFGRPMASPFQAIEQGGRRQRPQPQQQQQQQISPFGMSPFGGLGIFGGLGGHGGIFGAMEQMSQQAMNSPNAVVFSKSTMMTYGPDGRPQVVENTMRKVGDVKETKRHVRQGDELRTQHGKSIGNRTHFVEKKRDKDGNVRKQQKFINLDEAEVDDFDREFNSRAKMSSTGTRTRSNDMRYLENGSNSQGSSSAPIVTLPEEDDEEETRRNRSARTERIGGPIIREISDEEAEQSISKKRRGQYHGSRAQ